MVNSSIQMVPARQLMSPLRFDLMAKYAYAEYLLEGRESAFAEELYTKHIEAFSGGSFQEPGNESKNSAEAYRKMFRDLIDSIKTSGYDSRYPDQLVYRTLFFTAVQKHPGTPQETVEIVK